MESAGPNRAVTRAGRWYHGLVAALLAAMMAASFLGVDRWRLLPPAGRSPPAGEGPRAGAADARAPAAPGTTICALRMLTGVPCPTCGLTRSFCSIGRGEFLAAVEHHPLGPLLYVMFAVLLARSAAVAITGRLCLERAARLMVRSIVPLVLLAVAIWGVRMAMRVADGSASAAWHASLLGRLME